VGRDVTVPALAHDPAATRIAVVFGGPSAEHDVSIVSGTAILDALVASGYPVAAWVIDLGGGWWRLPDGHRRDGRPQAAYDDPATLGAEGPLSAAAALDRLAAEAPPPLVFLALHGPFGEDGTVQALCEAAGLAYTGSGVTASAIGMDKAVFKRLVRGLGLPVVDWREVRAARWARDPDGVLAELQAFAAGTGDARLMVKPARLGSSVGMTLAHGPGERAAALDEAFRYDDLALVERYLAGARDLEVSVIGNEPDGLELYGPGEVLAGHEFYDYQAKYTPGLSETTLTAEVTPSERAATLKLARDAYRATGCEGFARVDFLLADAELVVSEINTIPGFTPISLFPTLPAAGGYDFAAVCRRVVDLALARAATRVRGRLTAADLPR
jgi:D-alanine-D-alanine ligase